MHRRVSDSARFGAESFGPEACFVFSLRDGSTLALGRKYSGIVGGGRDTRGRDTRMSRTEKT